MKKFLPVLAALAILMWLPAGALAYTVSFYSTPVDGPWAVDAYAGGSGELSPIDHSGQTADQVYNGRETCTVVDEGFGESALADVSIIVTKAGYTYLPDNGGKDTFFTLSIVVHALQFTVDGSTGYAYGTVSPNVYFYAAKEGAATPIVKLDFALTGSGTGFEWVSPGTYSLVSNIPGGTNIASGYKSSPGEVIGNGSAFGSAAEGTQWLLGLYFFDELTSDDWGDIASQTCQYDVTVHLIETDCYDPAPVPPSVILLGSGLLSLALIRRRQGRSRQ